MGMMQRRRRRLTLALAACALSAAIPAAQAGDLTSMVPAIKRSVVGIGTFERTRSPATVFVGTGFVVGDGLSVITNAHVVPATLDGERMEQLGIVTGDGDMVRFRPAQLVARDTEHDLAHLRLSGTPLPARARKGRPWPSPVIRWAWCWACTRLPTAPPWPRSRRW
jgi:S1-C subfamily serine protease